MKYGKINRLKEDIGTAFDVLMYGSPIYQHGVKAGQWGRAAMNVAGTYANLKTEEKALGGNPASRVGRKFGLALAKSKYPRGTFNQRESMSAVRRAALLEGGWKQKPTLGDPNQRGVFEDYTPEEKVRAQRAAHTANNAVNAKAPKSTLSAARDRATPSWMVGKVGSLSNPSFVQDTQQSRMGAEAVKSAQDTLERVKGAKKTISAIGDQDSAPINRGSFKDVAKRREARHQIAVQKDLRRAKKAAMATVSVHGGDKYDELKRIGNTEGMDADALRLHTQKVGEARLGRLGKVEARHNRMLSRANNVTKPDKLYWDAKNPGMKGLGLMGAAFGIGAVKAIGNAARNVSSASSMGYRQLMGPLPPVESAGGRRGNLQEGSKTWETRRRLYGPPGRKHKHWKFDFNNPEHVKKALHLKGDSDIKKLMKSTAKI